MNIIGNLNFPTINEMNCLALAGRALKHLLLGAVQDTFKPTHNWFYPLQTWPTAIFFRLSFHFWTQCYKCCYSFISFGKQWPYLSFWNLKYFDKLPPTGLEVPLYNNYRKGNYDRMNEYFNNIQWSEVLSSSSIQDRAGGKYEHIGISR